MYVAGYNGGIAVTGNAGNSWKVLYSTFRNQEKFSTIIGTRVPGRLYVFGADEPEVPTLLEACHDCAPVAP